MKVDLAPGAIPPGAVAGLAAGAEAAGFDGLWLPETQHDPFVGLTVAAGATTRLHLGTSVAIAFARSPTVLAQTAWDLAALSGGRFELGLGTQVRAHVQRRFGMAWSEPAPGWPSGWAPSAPRGARGRTTSRSAGRRSTWTSP